jgi:predicted AlkP superfamily pyrophosphatase or phosphodiesterase
MKYRALRPVIHAALLLALTAITPHARAAGPGKQNDFNGRRVLIIGIDGCRRDVMEQQIKEGGIPRLAKLESESRAFWNVEAGGEPSGEKNQPTISGPGWSTLFTGVFADKHGVRGNGAKFSVGNFKTYPHFFKYVREAKPNAWLGSVVGDTWPEVNSILLKGSGQDLANFQAAVPAEDVMEGKAKRQLTDANVAKEAVRCLSGENPDVLFLHFLDVDHSGHQFGFGPQSPLYVSTLKKLDESVGTVLDALAKRARIKEESWLIVVMTDHGGRLKNHGGQSPEERQIFAFFHGPGFQPAGERSGKVYQTLVTPTVLNFLQIPINPTWGFESEALKPGK